MNFDYNEEQQLLADSIKRFVDKDYDFETRKKYVHSAEGYSPEVWSTLAEMGLLGLPFSPDYDGFGGGAVDLMSVMEAIGSGLVIEPYLPTVMAAQFVARGGSEAQKKALIPSVVTGETKLAFAQTEAGARYDLDHVNLSAKAAGGASYHELAPNTVLKGLMRRIDRGTEVTTHDEPKREPVA